MASSSAHHHWELDVFVSFRGHQVRDNFLSHLYMDLGRRGIEYYRDDDKRELGMFISDKLSHAIKHSRVSIALFSSKYAESRWCLDELVQILEVHKQHWDHVFIPIFYHVGAGDVKKQTGTFGEVFRLEVRKLVDEYLQGIIGTEGLNVIPSWKKALTEAGESSGLGFHHKEGSEAKFIEDVVDHLCSNVFPKNLPCLDREPVAIESRLEEVLSLLDMGMKDGEVPHVVGLHGDTGMGKTTLAAVVFMQARVGFEASHFVQLEKDVDFVYLANLQRKLLSDIFKVPPPPFNDLNSNVEEIKKKVRGRRLLLVLDNLTSKRQAEAFAVGGLASPFSSESRILITTRDEQLLSDLHVDEQRQLKLDKLGQSDAYLLFCRLAFGSDCPKEGTEDLCDLVLRLSDGCPSHLGHLADIVRMTKDAADCKVAIGKWERRQFPDRYCDRIDPLEGLRNSFIFSAPWEIPADNLSEEEETVDSPTESVIDHEEYASSGSPTGTETPVLSEKEEEGEVIDPLPSPIGLTNASETSEREENSTLQSVESEEKTWKLEKQDETSHALPFADQNGKQESIADTPHSPVIDDLTQKANYSNGHTPEAHQIGNAEEFNGVMNDYSKDPITDRQELFRTVVRVEERLLEAPKNLAEFKDFSTLSKLLRSLHASHVLPPRISLVCSRISSRLLFYNDAFAIENAHLEGRIYEEMERISSVTLSIQSQKGIIKKMKDEFSHLKVQEEETEQQINQLQEKISEIKRNMDLISRQEEAAHRDIEQLSLDLSKLEKEYNEDSRELYEFQNLLAESRGSLEDLRQVVKEAKSFLKS